MIVNIPSHATPHEAAILYVYASGIKRTSDIAEQLNYATTRPVQKVLSKFNKELKDLGNVSTQTRIIGNNTIYKP